MRSKYSTLFTDFPFPQLSNTVCFLTNMPELNNQNLFNLISTRRATFKAKFDTFDLRTSHFTNLCTETGHLKHTNQKTDSKWSNWTSMYYLENFSEKGDSGVVIFVSSITLRQCRQYSLPNRPKQTALTPQITEFRSNYANVFTYTQIARIEIQITSYNQWESEPESLWEWWV